MVAAPHRAGDRGPPRNGQRLSQGRRDPRPRAWRATEGVAAKTGHHAGGVHRPGTAQSGHFGRGVHRRERPKTGHQDGGVHRPPCGSTTGPSPERERVRAVLRDHRRGAGAWPQRRRHLARPRDDHGFPARYASVRRFVVHLRGRTPVEARVVITTAPGDDYGECSVLVSPEETRRGGAVFFRASFT